MGCFVLGAWAIAAFGGDFYVWAYGQEGVGGVLLQWTAETLFSSYAMIVWAGLFMIGIVIGRLDLTSRTVAGRMLVGGALFCLLFTLGINSLNHFVDEDAVASYTISEQQCMSALKRSGRLEEVQGAAVTAPGESVDGPSIPLSSLPPTCQRLGQLTVSADSFTSLEPHSNTTAWMIQTVSIGIAVLGLCLLLPAGVRRILWPVGALGSIALSAYVVQILLVRYVWVLAGNSAAASSDRPGTPWQLALLAGFAVLLLAMATAIRHFFKRGPFEWLLDRVSGASSEREPTKRDEGD